MATFVISEYLAVEILILLLCTLVGMLIPQRIGVILTLQDVLKILYFFSGRLDLHGFLGTSPFPSPRSLQAR